MMPPSTISVAMALAQCVAPKDLWLADRELTFQWPVSGLPDLVYMDNSKEFHAEALRSAAQEYGIDLEYRPKGLPHFGGHIERLIGTMMGAVHLIPGTTFSNVAERGVYPSAKKAVMTLSELERWFALLTDKRLRRGTHTSLAALEKDLRDWINTWNQNPKPFAWTKTADEILDRLTAYLQRIPGAGH